MPSADDASAQEQTGTPVAWRVNGWLFLATVASCFLTWIINEGPTRASAVHAAQFTAALLAILLAHEFGHYFAARIHRVDASLPFFIPLPVLSPFGTMGAVIRMRSVIPTRRALLDIGASGPLAGLALAVPLYAWGVAHSQVVAVDGTAGTSVELGTSLATMALDRLFGPTVTPGMDIMLSPVAYAAWAGMFVTMINVLPASQLDGGHVAYSLFGPRQNAIAQWVHRSMLAFFFVSVASFLARDLRGGLGLHHLGLRIHDSLFWLLWFEVLAVIGAVSSPQGGDRIGIRTRAVAILGLAVIAAVLHDHTALLPWMAWLVGLGVLLTMEVRWGALRKDSVLLDHPPTGAQKLGLGRAVVAVVTLLLFILLFMPTPFSI